MYVHDMDSCFSSLTEAQTQLFNSELESFVPAEVCISLKQGTGPAAVPVVDVGERVACGQLIGKSMAPTSLPVYASISGQVRAITEKRMSVSRNGQPHCDPQRRGQKRMGQGSRECKRYGGMAEGCGDRRRDGEGSASVC